MRRGWSLTIQIAVMGAVLSVIAMTAFLLATERSTSDRLIEQIDQDLGTQAREWQRTMRASPPTDGTALAARARTWLNRQREHPASQVQIISIVGGRTLSNQSDLVARSAATQADPRPVSTIRGSWPQPPGCRRPPWTVTNTSEC